MGTTQNRTARRGDFARAQPKEKHMTEAADTKCSNPDCTCKNCTCGENCTCEHC